MIHLILICLHLTARAQIKFNARQRLKIATSSEKPIEFEDLSSIPVPSSPTKATVHAIITSFSPMKSETDAEGKPQTRKRFFHGTVNDGIKKLRFIGFNEAQQAQLSKLHATKEPVILNNCTLTKAKNSAEVELKIGEYTDINKSSKSFHVKDWTPVGPTEDTLTILIKKLPDLPTFQKVTLPAAKVLQIDDATCLDDGRKCQNIVVADSTGSTRVTLWQQHVNTVTLDHTYKFANMMVNMFAHKKYLYTCKQGAHIEPAEELSEVYSDIKYPQSTSTSISNATIIAIPFFKIIKVCMASNCDGDVQVSRGKVGRCSQCNMAQRIDQCKQQASAKLHLTSPTTKNVYLFANGQVLAQITELPLEMVTEEALLCSDPFSLTYNNRMVITNITKN